MKPEAVFFAIGTGLVSAEGKERADDGPALSWNSAEAGEPGSSREIEENGFNQVVFGVSGGNEIGLRSEPCLIEEGVPGMAARLFGTHAAIFGEAGDVGSPQHERDVQGITELFGAEGLVIGFGPLAVMEVGGDNVVAEDIEKMQEARRIGPAAVSDNCGLAGLDEP